MLVDEWTLRIMASRRKATSHLGIKGEFRITSLAADILVSSRTILNDTARFLKKGYNRSYKY